MSQFNDLIQHIKELNEEQRTKDELLRLAALERIRELRRAYKEQQEREKSK